MLSAMLIVHEHMAARKNPDTLALLRAVVHMILVYAWPTDGVDAA